MSRKVTTNKRASWRYSDELMPYVPRRHLLTPGERRFFRCGLQPAVGDRWLIVMKPRLADLITTENFESRHGRRIAQKHVDWALVTPRTTRIVAAIELNDATHTEDGRRERDAFVGEALRVAGIPLIAFPVFQKYDSAKIRRHIFRTVKRFQTR